MSFRIGKTRIPIVQPNLRVTRDREYENVNIINGVRVTKLGNKGLLHIAYNSFFPNEWGSYCDVSKGQLKEPLKYCTQFESIRDNENYVRVIHTDEKINCMMKIISFERGTTNGVGDMSYSIELEEYNKIQDIKKIPETTNDTEVEAFTGTELTGDQREEKSVPSQTYIVKTGDCLYAIARKFNMNWTDLYNDNKTIIGNDPSLIYAGQELKVRGTAKTTKTLPNGRTYTVNHS